MRKATFVAALLLSTLALGGAGAQTERKAPYWASVSAGKALMRTGPGRNYPGTWLYVRADLPIRVIETYPNWRKVEDPDGEKGWMLQRLLSDTRTGLVKPGEPRPLYEKPDEHSPLRYRVEAGVVGRLSKCDGSWCRFEVQGRQAYIREDQLWGVDPGEHLD
jgi:SH3-like domain-containing protein